MSVRPNRAAWETSGGCSRPPCGPCPDRPAQVRRYWSNDAVARPEDKAEVRGFLFECLGTLHTLPGSCSFIATKVAKVNVDIAKRDW